MLLSVRVATSVEFIYEMSRCVEAGICHASDRYGQSALVLTLMALKRTLR